MNFIPTVLEKARVALFRVKPLAPYLVAILLAGAVSSRNWFVIPFATGTLLAAWFFFRRGGRITAALFLGVGVFWTVYFRGVFRWARTLGSDSFAEAQTFDLHEALFFLSSLWQVIQPGSVKSFVLDIASAIVLALVIRWALQKIVNVKHLRPSSVVMLMLVPFLWAVAVSVKSFENNSDVFNKVSHNFSHQISVSDAGKKNLKVLVYVGESTSAMNLQLYGYPRETTPRLMNLSETTEGMLVFENVFSTHTHTSLSLLEALSLGFGNDEGNRPIFDQRRVSIVDALNAGGVRTHLVSNQGQTGTWNLAGTILFKNAAHKVWGSDSRWLSNLEYKMEKPFDHELFARELPKALREPGPAVVFLHSYAGHGPYVQNIPPEFRRKVDSYFESMGPQGVLGEALASDGRLKRVESYDSAMRYVDYSVSEVINMASGSAEPVVVVYFADHGDSVFSGRAHDSSRFIHEMARVPYIVFFNDAARASLNEKYAALNAISDSRRPLTLRTVAPTILSLFGIAPEGQEKGFGNRDKGPIVFRKTNGGGSYVSLSPNAEIDSSFSEVTDQATQVFRTTQSNVDPLICYHRSNTIAKALRGALVSNCLEFDLVVEKDGRLDVYHPPASSANVTLQDIVSIANSRGVRGIWIDGKNLDVPENCKVLSDFISGQTHRPENVLVEFPSQTDFYDDATLKGCSESLQRQGIRTSYYVPTKTVIACANAIRDKAVESKECRELNNKLAKAANSDVFTDFSFDVRGLTAMRTLSAGKLLRWNTWGVQAGNLAALEGQQFGMVIVRTKADPNGR